jgi:hypothetical protein
MAFKRISYGDAKYVINTDHIAYISQNDDGSSYVAFAAGGAGDRRLGLQADQSAEEILAGETIK